jgi:chromate transport protein ChrA
MRDILIVRNEWFDEGQFTELFTIGQGLLEPTLVKLVISTALVQAGLIRGVTVFFLLNLPRIIVF